MRTGIITLAMLPWAGAAAAHAFLDVADPPVGSTGAAPRQVVITFTQSVEPVFSTISVVNAAGARVDRGAPHPGSDPQHLVVELPTLPPGRYHVFWRAVSIDTHRTQGDYMFTVAP